MHRKKKENKENSERWLLTYSDLMNLLLILFILLYTMSSVNETKYAELSASLSGVLGSGSSILDGAGGGLVGTEEGNPAATETATESPSPTDEGNQSGGIYTPEDMNALKGKIDQILAEYNGSGSITTNISEIGLTISFADDIFFDSGQDQIKDNMKTALKTVSLMLAKIDNSILVEGHTDNIPINNSKFSSNWQLSSIRAANVVKYLIDEGQIDDARLSAIAYGDTRPAASNDTEEGRSRNRRINLIIIYNQVH